MPTRAEYLAMISDADDDAAGDDDEQDELPEGTRRALGRLQGGSLSRKDVRLSRRTRLPRNPSPKTRIQPRIPDGLAAWQALREIAYQRADYRCERCGVHRDQAFGQVLDGHHRKLRSRGGLDELCNIAVLCRICHEWAHKHVRTATGLGYIVPSRSDPARRGMLLPDGRLVRLDNAGGYVLAA